MSVTEFAPRDHGAEHLAPLTTEYVDALNNAMDLMPPTPAEFGSLRDIDAGILETDGGVSVDADTGSVIDGGVADRFAYLTEPATWIIPDEARPATMAAAKLDALSTVDEVQAAASPALLRRIRAAYPDIHDSALADHVGRHARNALALDAALQEEGWGQQDRAAVYGAYEFNIGTDGGTGTKAHAEVIPIDAYRDTVIIEKVIGIQAAIDRAAEKAAAELDDAVGAGNDSETAPETVPTDVAALSASLAVVRAAERSGVADTDDAPEATEVAVATDEAESETAYLARLDQAYLEYKQAHPPKTMTERLRNRLSSVLKLGRNVLSRTVARPLEEVTEVLPVVSDGGDIPVAAVETPRRLLGETARRRLVAVVGATAAASLAVLFARNGLPIPTGAHMAAWGDMLNNVPLDGSAAPAGVEMIGPEQAVAADQVATLSFDTQERALDVHDFLGDQAEAATTVVAEVPVPEVAPAATPELIQLDATPESGKYLWHLMADAGVDPSDIMGRLQAAAEMAERNGMEVVWDANDKLKIDGKADTASLVKALQPYLVK